jgi:hypothetical protein
MLQLLKLSTALKAWHTSTKRRQTHIRTITMPNDNEHYAIDECQIHILKAGTKAISHKQTGTRNYTQVMTVVKFNLCTLSKSGIRHFM